jgi:hypothetical protein
MKIINDVNEMRLEAASLCGDLTRLSEQFQRDGGDAWGIANYTNRCLETGTVVQYARDLGAWVELRDRIEKLMQYHDRSSDAMAALRDVLDVMDELED